MKDKTRIPTSGEPIPWRSPFAALKNAGLPLAPAAQPGAPTHNAPSIPSKKNRGRVNIIRQTAHRGGKTVTVITGFTDIGQTEQEMLAKEIQQTCGVGGTVKEGRIEIQGDQRTAIVRILTNAGFQPVLAGG